MNIALVVKASDGTQSREHRNMGYWSYSVPEFRWHHFVFDRKAVYATNEMNNHDIIFQEDAGPRYFKNKKKPLVYLAIDSTLSDKHLEARLERAKRADLILVDQDKLENFAHLGIPVRRFNYCVNDFLFRACGLERSIDVSFYCGSNNERGRIREMMREYSREEDIVFKTGTLPVIRYALAMANSKIVLNWPRVPTNRPHRVFDAMACGACLVTGPIPDVSGDKRVKGRDYVQVERIEDIPKTITSLLKNGDWKKYATRGQQLILRHHLWSIRARQLKRILEEELG